MGLHRRDFLKQSLAQAALISLPLKISAQPLIAARRTGPSIVQGATDETSTQFSIVHPVTDSFDLVVSAPSGQTWSPTSQKVLTRAKQKTAITKVKFEALYSGQLLTLTLFRKGTQTIVDERTFQTLNLSKSGIRFAICSCMDDKHHDPEIWRDLVSRTPDVILFVGDSTYADKETSIMGEATPDTLWRRFSESRQTLEIYYSKKLIPILAVWDDHDFGHNDSDSLSYPYVKESQKNFESFFAQDGSSCRTVDNGPGVSVAFNFASHLFLLLDDRSYRLQSGSKERYAQWGKQQEEWLLKKIANHHGPVWLMNGSQYFPSVPWKESVSRNHPYQFSEFLKQLRAKNRKIVFVSGDVHYSEISRIEPEVLGYETFEVTSSSVHSTSFPGFPGIVPNPRRILSTGERNYILVDSRALASGSKARIASCSAGGRVNFVKDIQL